MENKKRLLKNAPRAENLFKAEWNRLDPVERHLLEVRHGMLGVPSDLNKVKSLIGSAYEIVCNAVDRCFVRRKTKTASRRRVNSRRSRTRKAKRV